MENNRAIYPCICMLSKNTDKMSIALVQQYLYNNVVLAMTMPI